MSGLINAPAELYSTRSPTVPESRSVGFVVVLRVSNKPKNDTIRLKNNISRLFLARKFLSLNKQIQKIITYVDRRNLEIRNEFLAFSRDAIRLGRS